MKQAVGVDTGTDCASVVSSACIRVQSRQACRHGVPPVPRPAAAASARLLAPPLRRLALDLHQKRHMAAPNLKQLQHVVQRGVCLAEKQLQNKALGEAVTACLHGIQGRS